MFSAHSSHRFDEPSGAERRKNIVQEMRFLRSHIVTAFGKCAMFRGGSNVDIVGVTGSIPVTPTIQNNNLAICHIVPTRFNEPRSRADDRL